MTATATPTLHDSLSEIKNFAATLDGFKADFDKRKKSEWLAAIARYEAAKATVIKAVEPIAIETVEPIAQSIEATAVEVHSKLTSPKAVSGYQVVLRGAIWIGVGLVLAVGLVYTLAALAWDAIDGEPAILCWIRAYAKSAQGQELIGWASECRRSLASIPQSWVEGTIFDQG